jgi:hypothetical protein
MFLKLDCFPSSDEGKEIPTVLGPSERANLYQQSMCFPINLKTGTDPVAETYLEFRTIEKGIQIQRNCSSCGIVTRAFRIRDWGINTWRKHLVKYWMGSGVIIFINLNSVRIPLRNAGGNILETKSGENAYRSENDD